MVVQMLERTNYEEVQGECHFFINKEKSQKRAAKAISWMFCLIIKCRGADTYPILIGLF